MDRKSIFALLQICDFKMGVSGRVKVGKFASNLTDVGFLPLDTSGGETSGFVLAGRAVESLRSSQSVTT